MIRNIFLLLIVFFCFSGCSQNRKKENPIHNTLQQRYDETVSFFGKDLMKHFPVKIDFSKTLFTESFSPKMGNLEVKLWNTSPLSNISSFENEIKSNCIAEYSASDSCLLIVNPFIDLDSPVGYSPTISEEQMNFRMCAKDKYPVPNFWHNDYTTSHNKCRLPDDFVIYVLDAQSGKFMKEDLLTQGKYLPSSWRNGFSRGVAISEFQEVAIYWVIVW